MPCRPQILVLLLLAACGCAGTSPSGDAVAASRPQWFCDAAADGTDWNCIRSETPISRAPTARRPAPVVETHEPPETAVRPSRVERSVAAPNDTPAQPSATGAVPLVDLPSNYYVVQLLALSSKDALQALATELNVPNLSGAAVESDGQLFYVLLLGAYPDRAAAERAIAERPEALASFAPWIRSLGSLKEGMWRAQSSPSALSSAE
jgi:septal ring-binding cell division protein DamX